MLSLLKSVQVIIILQKFSIQDGRTALYRTLKKTFIITLLGNDTKRALCIHELAFLDYRVNNDMSEKKKIQFLYEKVTILNTRQNQVKKEEI